MPAIIEGLGSELVVDEIFLVMREELNNAITDISDDLDSVDQAFASRAGIEYVALEMELVDDTPRGGDFPFGNFHIGDIPSFVQTEDRVANYPMVVVMPGVTTPDPENITADQYDVYGTQVQIHVFSRANPAEGPLVAYRRSMRMAEAVHQVVKTTNLWHLVAGVSGPQLVQRSEPWFFPSEDGHGEDWCWRAVMHQYQVKNYSITP